MQWIPSPSDAASLKVRRPYHLRRTLECGQAFRWTATDGEAVGVVARRVWRVRQVPGWLHAQDGELSAGWINTTDLSVDLEGLPGLWRHLGANEPLRRVERTLARDPLLCRVLPHTSGIALMRQDPWECLLSFVISQFNNIPKIRMTIERLSSTFGQPLGNRQFGFPEPERLAEASMRSLRTCILGYRAGYVRAVARAVADRTIDLAAVQSMPVMRAREALLVLPGVGEKVAECVLLFGLGHSEAFPVDVWIRRAVERFYLRGRRASPRIIREWASERFGPLAGYANQHLFAAARTSVLTSV